MRHSSLSLVVLLFALFLPSTSWAAAVASHDHDVLEPAHEIVLGTDPIVGEKKDGTLVDKRNGRPLVGPELENARELEKFLGPVKDVVLDKWESDRYEVGWYQKGRETLKGGGPDDPGELNLDHARFEAGASTTVGARSFQSSADAKLTLVGVNGKVGGAWDKDPNALNNMELNGSGDVSIAAAAEYRTVAAYSEKGVMAEGTVGASLGVKAEGQITASPTLCGAQLDVTGRGQASLGIGAEGTLKLRADLAKMKFKVGGKLAATFGVGLGAGGDIEINLEKVMKDRRAALDCFTSKSGIDVLTAGYVKIQTLAVQHLAETIRHAGAGRFEKQGTAGTNVGRFQETRPLGAPQPPRGRNAGGGATR